MYVYGVNHYSSLCLYILKRLSKLDPDKWLQRHVLSTFMWLSAFMLSLRYDAIQYVIQDLERPRVISSGTVYQESITLKWRHNGRDGASNHQPHNCLLNRLFRCRSKKTSKLRVTGLRAGNSPVTGEFPAQMASNAEIVSIWWYHEPFLQWRFNHRLYAAHSAVSFHHQVNECTGFIVLNWRRHLCGLPQSMHDCLCSLEYNRNIEMLFRWCCFCTLFTIQLFYFNIYDNRIQSLHDYDRYWHQ